MATSITMGLLKSRKLHEKGIAIHCTFIRTFHAMMLLLLACLLLLPTATNADCLPFDLAPTMREEFVTAELVARITIKDPPESIQLPCGFPVYREAGYVIEDKLPAYEILELFRGKAPDGDIPIIWWTDTGYETTIPVHITDDDEGFLAVMNGFRTCQNETNDWIYEDDYEPLPYELGQCSYSNQPWSSVSDVDREWLRQQAVRGGEDSLAPIPTAPAVIPVEPVPTPASPVPPEPTVELVVVQSLVPSSTGDASLAPSSEASLDSSIFPSTELSADLAKASLGDGSGGATSTASAHSAASFLVVMFASIVVVTVT